MSYSKEFEVGPAEVLTFANLVQDHNPVHLDAEYAQSTRYGSPICHGMLVASYISGCLVEAHGQGTVYVQQEIRFRRPVPVGSRIRVVFGPSEPLEKGQIRHSTSIEILQGQVWKKALEGSATVIPGQSG